MEILGVGGATVEVEGVWMPEVVVVVEVDEDARVEEVEGSEAAGRVGAVADGGAVRRAGDVEADEAAGRVEAVEDGGAALRTEDVESGEAAGRVGAVEEGRAVWRAGDVEAGEAAGRVGAVEDGGAALRTEDVESGEAAGRVGAVEETARPGRAWDAGGTFNLLAAIIEVTVVDTFGLAAATMLTIGTEAFCLLVATVGVTFNSLAAVMEVSEVEKLWSGSNISALRMLSSAAVRSLGLKPVNRLSRWLVEGVF